MAHSYLTYFMYRLTYLISPVSNELQQTSFIFDLIWRILAARSS
ncbi:hypothetical protein KVC_0953 [Ketogulonicigenium vulgare]|uniref:Uncharacterized protein n=1 Tax=Ketogulonicigenium vulgare (strain WSH-001) TaxID=759362 RepID=F9YA90_KETVW|nr:hypothetical protein KVU_0424 [Ketogulonicigenium vulgare WSH-001]AOZ53970.1 hypothetical protein KVC_0953 [Ketogulonicigenium vulgare]